MSENKFVHLHVHTEYSLLDGAAKISKLFKTCVERNFPAIAMTDHGNMYGAVKFVTEAEEFNAKNKTNIKPIIGCEFYMCDDMHVKTGRVDLGHLILLAKTQEGYSNLVKLCSTAFVEGKYYKPRIDYKYLSEHSKGLVCLSGCVAGHIQQFLLKNMYDEAKKLSLQLKSFFDEGDFYIELQNHGIPEQLAILEKQKELARDIGVKTVVTNDAHYVNKDEAEMQDIMLCVQTNKRFNDPDRMRMPCEEFYLKTYDEMHNAFPSDEEALATTLEIAEKCNATVLFHLPLSPKYLIETNESADDMLKRITWDGLKERYGDPLSQTIIDRANYELSVIISMGYSDYFLVVWDYVKFAEEHNIPVGPGRGSGAGSIVAYALKITKVEPLKYDLLFERFLNPSRISMPDIDLDFCFERRGEVIDYVKEKYGEDRVCQIVTFGTMQAKAAIKDVARALNVSYEEVNKITKGLPDLKNVGKDPLRKVFGYEVSPENEKYTVPELKKIFDENEQMQKVIKIAIRLEGMPRHTGMHAAGVVICREKISDFVPLSESGGFITTEYDMNELEKIGIYKMDFLGLKTLTDLQRTIDLIQEIHGVKVDFYAKDFSYENPEVFKVIANGNTDAIFQLESSGMKIFMKDLRPDTLEDLIAGIAMYRPGPMSMIPQFVEGKHKPETITYMHPKLEPILGNTYGCIVYQEQVMRIFQDLAGYDLAQADNVRKFMSKKKMDKLLEEREAFVNGRKDKRHDIVGCVANGISADIANELFTKMEAFGAYAFNKSHSAVYAYIAYQTAYLKLLYETEFICSVLNNRINNSDDIKKYLLYAKNRGIEVLPPSVNKSSAYFRPEGKNKIRFGLAALKNVGIKVVDELIKKRNESGCFKDLPNLITNLDGQCLNKRFIESAILSGAMDEFNVPRSQLMAVYAELIDKTLADKKNKESGQFNFFSELGNAGDILSVNYPNIPEFKDQIKLKFEKEVLGTYISGHPLNQYSNKFQKFNLTGEMLKPIEGEIGDEVIGLDEDDIETKATTYDASLQNNMPVTCGGIVLEVNRKFSKTSGKEFAFLTIEDLEGTIEVMCFGSILDRYKDRLENDSLVTIIGKLSIRDDKAPIVMAEKIMFWTDEESPTQEVIKEANTELEAPKRLYLKFSTLDNMLSVQVMNVLHCHSGNTEVFIRCSETGQAFKHSEKVEPCSSLMYELQAILGEDNVMIKEIN